MRLLDIFDRRRAKQRRADDLDELHQLRTKYGATTGQELDRRAKDRNLNGRDRRHWRRLMKLDARQN